MLTARYEYTAFGAPVTCNLSPVTRSLAFSSKEYDTKSGLSYYGFRHYDADSGRWISKEPSGFDGPNLYSFVRDNPQMFVDYYGLWGTDIHSTFGHIQPTGNEFFDYTEADKGGNQLDEDYHLNSNKKDIDSKIENAIKCCFKNDFQIWQHAMQDYYGHIKKLGMNRASPATQWIPHSRHDIAERRQQGIYNDYDNKQGAQAEMMENDPYFRAAEAETIRNENRWFKNCGFRR